MSLDNKLCTYCRKPIETLVRKNIVFRDYDHTRQKQFVNTKEFDFCSTKCASNEQCSREG